MIEWYIYRWWILSKKRFVRIQKVKIAWKKNHPSLVCCKWPSTFIHLLSNITFVWFFFMPSFFVQYEFKFSGFLFEVVSIWLYLELNIFRFRLFLLPVIRICLSIYPAGCFVSEVALASLFEDESCYNFLIWGFSKPVPVIIKSIWVLKLVWDWVTALCPSYFVIISGLDLENFVGVNCKYF